MRHTLIAIALHDPDFRPWFFLLRVHLRISCWWAGPQWLKRGGVWRSCRAPVGPPPPPHKTKKTYRIVSQGKNAFFSRKGQLGSSPLQRIWGWDRPEDATERLLTRQFKG